MLASFGEIAIIIALIFCLFGFIASVFGKDSRLAEVGRRAALPMFLFVTAAVIILEIGLLKNDTGLRYVVNHSALTSPVWVKIVSLWGALEGSILLWAWLLSLYLFLVSRLAKNDVLKPYALAVLFFIQIFFLLVNATVGSPFIANPIAVADGVGPNAFLQNHWMMAVHPVLMYLGFVGLSVPFAYAIAALITGRLGETWLSQTRRWTITAFAFLSAAIVAGGWWSYEVLGWGGYWAWDPVENASIIPWFFATAFLHSLQIQERRRILKGWNLALIIAAFASTILGTFLTRSGVVESVHAFASGPIGPVFLGFLAVIILGSLFIAYRRLPAIRDQQWLDSPLSREGILLAGNLVFCAFALTVILGTLFPVFVEAFSGKTTTVGAPFFNQVAEPFGLLLLLLQGLGPAFAWRRIEKEKLLKILLWPMILAVISIIIALIFGIGKITVILTIAFSILNIAIIGILTWRASVQQAKSSKNSILSSFGNLLNTHPRRYGAYIAHFGVVIIALGISFSNGYKQEGEYSFKPGQNREELGVKMQYRDLVTYEEPQRQVIAASMIVEGKELFPRLNFYGNQREPVATPAILYHFFGDTYTTLLSFDQNDRTVVVRLIQSPLVSWIWFGGLILILGTVVTLVPAVVEQKSSNKEKLHA